MGDLRFPRPSRVQTPGLPTSVPPIIADLGQLMEPTTAVTPPFNPNAPAPGTPQGANPAGPQGQGGILGLLRDPRTTAFLLSFANRLSQPLGLGETPTTAATQSLLSGYNALALARLMQAQREAEGRKEQRETAESGAKVEEARARAGHARAQEQDVLGRTPGAQAGARKTTAEAAKLEGEAGRQERELELKEIQADLNTRTTEIAERRLGLDERTAAENAAMDERKFRQEEAKLRHMQRTDTDELSIRRQSQLTRAAEARATIAKLNAEVVLLKKRAESGVDVDPDTLARIKTEGVKAAALVAELSEDFEGTFAERNKILQRAIDEAAGAKPAAKPAEPPKGPAPEAKDGEKTNRLQQIRNYINAPVQAAATPPSPAPAPQAAPAATPPPRTPATDDAVLDQIISFEGGIDPDSPQGVSAYSKYSPDTVQKIRERLKQRRPFIAR